MGETVGKKVPARNEVILTRAEVELAVREYLARRRDQDVSAIGRVVIGGNVFMGIYARVTIRRPVHKPANPHGAF